MARMTIQQLCRENQIYKLKVIQLTKERQMLECDYNARLKADMAAMLTEIQLEIEESENCGKAFHLGLQMASNIIQQKIDAIKEQKDETDESNK